MEGINRALRDDFSIVLETLKRDITDIKTREVPCVFISYQRGDETFASEVANYFLKHKVDVYFDINDQDLKLQM